MADSDKDEAQSAIAKFKPNLVLEDGHVLSIQLKKPKGPECDVAKTVIAFEFDTERLERYFALLSKLQRRDRPVALGFSFVEQLELPKEEPKAEQNGHGPATGGLTPIEGGKGPKKKAREKTPV